MSELDQLRQEAEQLKNQIRVGSTCVLSLFYKSFGFQMRCLSVLGKVDFKISIQCFGLKLNFHWPRIC